MILLAISVSTVLGAVVGFGLGRLKTWVVKCEQNFERKQSDKRDQLLRTRLRVKGIAVKGIVK